MASYYAKAELNKVLIAKRLQGMEDGNGEPEGDKDVEIQASTE